jgi:BirA family transcriptional regulator, biotin operon repressor / biotin---[acetyl-CoA-carboxylase] ligase
MLEAARRVAGLTRPLWICALTQTQARGRRGREWVMPQGNFAATLVMPVQGGPGQAALRSFVAALALFDTVADLTGRPAALGLKWPNDVLLNGGKLAGILLETLPRAGWLAIGIGVNLIAAPSSEDIETGAVRPVSLSGEIGLSVSPQDFLDLLAGAFSRWEDRLQTEGFTPIRQAFLARAARLGQVITARLPHEAVTGTFDTMDETGQLVLKTAQGVRLIPAADIYF